MKEKRIKKKNTKKIELVSQKEIQDFLQSNKEILSQEIICGLCM